MLKVPCRSDSFHSFPDFASLKLKDHIQEVHITDLYNILYNIIITLYHHKRVVCMLPLLYAGNAVGTQGLLHHKGQLRLLTRLVIWMSVMKKWTCFSPLFRASFLVMTATIMAVLATPWQHTNTHTHSHTHTHTQTKSRSLHSHRL